MTTVANHRAEVAVGERFEFGKNWSRFLERFNEERLAKAEASLREFLGRDHLNGVRILDLGSGSGLFSLAARKLGANVVSVDYDPQCVACAKVLRERFFPQNEQWRIIEGSALDRSFLSTLGRFDIVYSWGVLHHTGRMWDAIRNAASLVDRNGLFFLSIYNDQGRASRVWTRIKRAYNRLPSGLRPLLIAPCAVRLWGPTMIRDLVKGKPGHTWKHYGENRGMSAWDDMIDWIGGYPFEVAKPEQIFEFLRPLGFSLERLKTCAGGIGCNEFLFVRRNEPHPQ